MHAYNRPETTAASQTGLGNPRAARACRLLEVATIAIHSRPEPMTQAFDFSEAALISAPEAVRDGGSVCLVLRIEGTDYNLRYAGGFWEQVLT